MIYLAASADQLQGWDSHDHEHLSTSPGHGLKYVDLTKYVIVSYSRCGQVWTSLCVNEEKWKVNK